MPNAFNFSASPFDCLTPDEQRLVRDSVDVAYFPRGATVLDIGATPEHLYVIIKGFVTQYDGDEVITTYGPDDTFDGRALMAGKVGNRFIATEEVVAYQLAKQAVTGLIASNANFGALLFADLSDKLKSIASRKSQHEVESLAMARVDEAFVRPALFVEPHTDILSVVRLLQEQRASSVLVRDPAHEADGSLGIFTSTMVQKAVLDGRPLHQLAVSELANFKVITVRPSDQLGDAMASMLRHRVHRVVVKEGDEIHGVLEALDLFSYMSNQSHLITERIEEARDLEGLSQAAAQITRMIASMFRSGTRVHLIATVVQQLNARLFERAWQLIAPPELVANSCLFVMGSEGRGEQLLKTDQDNGLILRDGYIPPAQLDMLCVRFSDALKSFGYPVCPGGIMVSNPAWRGDVTSFSRTTRQWLMLPTDEGLMNLAIFMDAHAVCGDVTLLQQVQESLMKMATDNDAILARFASAIDAFATSAGWWNRLLGLDSEELLNLKKAGIFPLVHGVRSLAFAHQVLETGTEARLQVLVERGHLPADMGADLRESLQFFMGLKLKAGLQEIDTDKPVTGSVDIAHMSSLDRDLLKDTLGVVKRFRTLLRQRFRLDVVS
jgi:CBS domain-containing protein